MGLLDFFKSKKNNNTEKNEVVTEPQLHKDKFENNNTEKNELVTKPQLDENKFENNNTKKNELVTKPQLDENKFENNNTKKNELVTKPQLDEDRFEKEIYSELKEKLQKLKTLDKRFAVFGANSHLYNLKETIELKTILQFEEENGIILPQDYKGFLTNIGNGGAGSGYRMMSLKAETGIKTPFKGVDNLLKTYAEIQWNQDREKLISLYGHELKIVLGENFENYSTEQLFNVAIETNLDFTNQYFNIAEPQNRYIIDPIVNRHTVYLETNRMKEFTGYLRLFAEGCGHEYGLVVNGEDYGKIVMFGNDGQLAATNQSFIEFYNTWLDGNLAQFEKVVDAMKTNDINVLFDKDFWSNRTWELEKILCSILDVDKPSFVWGTDDYKKYILSLIERWKISLAIPSLTTLNHQ